MLKGRQSIISEEHLYFIWQHKLFSSPALIGEKAEKIVIEFQGIRNLEDGPDFKDARIWINGKLLIGDVELHIYNSDWYLHNHGKNTAYKNVVLHVCMWRDYSNRNDGSVNIPELILEPYLAASIPDLINKAKILSKGCYLSPQDLDSKTIGDILDEAGDRHFQLKCDRFKQLLEMLNENEVLYRGIAEALGYKNNKAQFLELAKRMPYEYLTKLKNINDLEDALLYCGGFIYENQSKLSINRMDMLLWRPFGRPANNPINRIKSLAKIIHATSAVGLTKYFLNIISGNAINVSKRAVVNTFLDCGIGTERGKLILFNVILPFSSSYSDNSLLKRAIKDFYYTHPPISSNIIIKNAGVLLFRDGNVANERVNTVRKQIGLQQLYREKQL